jgi:hypothetical protein
MTTRDGAAVVGAVVVPASLWTLASIAARKRGNEVSAVRYASSPAMTSGNVTSGSGMIAAPASPPRRKSRFHRKKNAAFR